MTPSKGFQLSAERRIWWFVIPYGCSTMEGVWKITLIWKKVENNERNSLAVDGITPDCQVLGNKMVKIATSNHWEGVHWESK